ncbi:MAG: hypothetical protein IJE89_03555 [Bacilli bacterium]|nr:hypothetical protein [Bacilli bacterium]
MKKLGKKFSFLTKIMLVVGLLISNLSSLTYVFADEIIENISVTLNDKSLEIKYLEELTEDVESVNVKITEDYIYLDNSSEFEEKKVTEYNDLEVESFLSDGLNHETVLMGTDPEKLENIEVFDGLYDVRVEITDLEGNEIDTVVYSKRFENKGGLEVKLYDESDIEITALENGRYSISRNNLNVKAVARVLAGGLTPNMQFKYNNQEYSALQLTELVFDGYNYDFSGLLYGNYSTPLEVKLLQKVETVEEGVEPEFEEIIISKRLDFAYEKLSVNTEALNFFTQRVELNDAYYFSGNSNNGVIYTLLDLSEETKARTMLDLYKIAEIAFGGIDTFKYVLSNSSNEDIIKAYEELTTPEVSGEEGVQVVVDTTSEEKTLEEYLSEIILDDSASLTVKGEGLTEADEGITITYDVTVIGDVNKDNKLDKADLTKLIEEVVTGNVSDKLTSDVALFDGKVNTLDVMLLNQVINTKDWYSSLADTIEGELLAKLEVSEEEITSGDTFTVKYVLSLADYDVNGLTGLFKYNKEVFELVSMEVDNEWLGMNKDGKFLYLTDELLTAPEITEPEENPETPEVTPEQDTNSNDSVAVITEGDVSLEEEIPEETPIVTEDYVILTATFKALKASSLEDGNVITLDNIELFNDDVYVELDTTKVESEVIVVNADTNNKLASLKVAGQEIELLENVYEYELAVKNEVTTADLEYVLESATANISSIVAPEELAEGENKITITVVSESGLEQVYTIVVTREAAPKKEVVVSTDNYYGDYDNDQKEEIIVTPAPEEEEEVVEPEEKSGTLSRVIIIVLILLVIAGLIYLIFKDEDDAETKKANKEINKLKKEDKEIVVEKTTKLEQKPTKKVDNSNKKKSPKNKKKER